MAKSGVQDTLKAMGTWLKQYGESIHGTRGNIVPLQEWGVITVKDKTVLLMF
jgi:alpha-L-fucosidase